MDNPKLMTVYSFDDDAPEEREAFRAFMDTRGEKYDTVTLPIAAGRTETHFRIHAEHYVNNEIVHEPVLDKDGQPLVINGEPVTKPVNVVRQGWGMGKRAKELRAAWNKAQNALG